MKFLWWHNRQRASSLSRSRTQRPFLETLEDRRLLATFTVFNTLDDLYPGSLRREILDSNATPGPNTILFRIGSGVQIIQPASPLPAIINPVTLAGYNQPGYSGNPLVVLDGTHAGSAAGLVLAAGSSGSEVDSLVIDHFASAGILIQSDNNHIYGDYVGTDATGTMAAGNAIGVDIQGGKDNTIGEGAVLIPALAPLPPQLLIGYDVVSGNTLDGVRITGSSATGNLVQGSFLGTDRNGVAAVPNGGAGVVLDGARANTIGGTTMGVANVISGNGDFGVYLLDGASNNVVEQDAIGTAGNLMQALPNGYDGVFLFGAADNTIGGLNPNPGLFHPALGNVIAGNGRFGVFLLGNGTTGNALQNNLIGLDGAGAALPNGADGVAVFTGASGNTIGGTAASADNVISGNARFGVFLFAPVGAAPASGNVLQGNLIGTNVTGTAAAPNAADGVALFSWASSNTIGGTAPGAGNLISGNANDGLHVALSDGNVVQGNLIGTDASGTTGLVDSGGLVPGGVVLDGAANNTIGGTTGAARNVISGNAQRAPEVGFVGHGLVLQDAGTTGNVVEGNVIGANAAGLAALPLISGSGILIQNGAADNTIGGTAAGAGNVVSGNLIGIDLEGSGTSGNLIQGNNVGTDASGTRAVPNQGDGIRVGSQVTDTTIGGTAAGAGNVIAGNGPAYVSPLNVVQTADGIHLGNASTSGTLIQGNFIGTDRGGTLALGNTGDGVGIAVDFTVDTTGNATANTVGGTVAGAGNVIANNGGAGVVVQHTTGSNPILGNSIFNNTKLGIDLGGDGVTPNTPGGPHMGPNEFQNFPVLNSVTFPPVVAGGGLSTPIGGLLVSVSLNSTPGHTFRLEFFANAAPDRSGYGQGQTFLAAANVTTDGSGNVTQTVFLPAILPPTQHVLSATATDLATDDTSEFCADLTVSG